MPLAFYQLALAAGCLVVWQTASGRWVKEIYISSPLLIWSELLELFGSGSIWPHIQITMLEFSVGYVIGSVGGIAAGVFLARLPTLAALLDPFILALYSIPKISLAPLFIIWLGIDAGPKLAIAALSAFFLVFLNSYAGMRSINEEYVSLARLMGASNFYLFRRILAPAALPGIMLGLRAGVPYAMIGAIVGEYIASSRGLGYMVLRAGSLFDSASLFANVLVIVVIVAIATQLLVLAERHLVRWRPLTETRVEM